jgi:hypothetical protein
VKLSSRHELNAGEDLDDGRLQKGGHKSTGIGSPGPSKAGVRPLGGEDAQLSDGEKERGSDISSLRLAIYPSWLPYLILLIICRFLSYGLEVYLATMCCLPFADEDSPLKPLAQPLEKRRACASAQLGPSRTSRGSLSKILRLLLGLLATRSALLSRCLLTRPSLKDFPSGRTLCSWRG